MKLYFIIFDPNPLIQDIELGKTSINSKNEFYISYIYDSEQSFFDAKSIEIKVEIKFQDEKIFETKYKSNIKNEIDFGNINVEASNIGITGRIIDENGKPLVGLVVEAWGLGKIESSIKDNFAVKMADKILPFPLTNDSELAHSNTDKNGYYEILYPPSKYSKVLNEKPDILIIIKDVLGVAELYRTEKFSAVSDTIKKLEDIKIKRNWADGWFVTLGHSGKSRFTTNNELEILIDNKIELERVVQSINDSISYIYLSQIEFSDDFVATFKSEDDVKLHPKDVLVDVLKRADERGVKVKIILNENLAVPDSTDEIKDYFKSSGVEVREFKSNGLHVMHAKILVVDGKEAYVIGSPFIQEYWDSNEHLINDPRRKPEHVHPVHDVSINLRGGSILDVEEFFIEMWNYISTEEFQGKGKLNPYQHKKNESEGKTPVQIVRSVTRGTLSKNGESGIFEGYRKAIANAQDFIYLENQYFTNKSIVKALKNAMNANAELQVIVVLNENPDLPKYKKWQNKAIKNFGINSVQDNIEHPQIGFFSLWSTELWGKKTKIQPIYVHSKVAIIDDLWATIGTANLDGSSLTQVELEGFLDIKLNRNMEINVLIPELNNNSTDVVKGFRNSLWEGHLGKTGMYQNKRSEEGWLVNWQKIANENMNLLKQYPTHLKSRILPYSTSDSIEDQLIDLDISIE